MTENDVIDADMARPLPFAYMIQSTAVFGGKFLSGEARPA
jgi:hypothetical protein